MKTGGQPHRRRLKSPFDTKTDTKKWGEAKLREFEREMMERDSAQDAGVTVLEAIPAYLLGSRARMKGSTLYTTEGALQRYIAPVLGHVRVSAITYEHMVTLLGSLGHLQPSTQRRIIAQFSGLLRHFHKTGQLPSMPMMPEIKVPPSKGEAYSDDDVQRLVDAAMELGPDFAAIVLLGADAGLRRGEIGALRWEDVGGGVIRVRRNLSRGEEVSPKSNRIRRVPMSERLEQALSHIPEKSGRVIMMMHGRTGTTVLRTAMGRVERLAGVGSGTGRLHILRHSFTTRALEHGAPLHVVSNILGHASIKTTERYAHPNEEARRRAIDGLGNPLAPTAKAQKTGSQGQSECALSTGSTASLDPENGAEEP